MNRFIQFFFIAGLFGLIAISPINAEETKNPAHLDVLKMSSVPDGMYAVTFEIKGNGVKTEFRIKSGVAKCVKSENAPGDRELKGAYGTFALIANGVFMLQLQGEGSTASQFWAFKPDGSAEIKEIPDRGEEQKAVPIKSTK